MRERWVPWVREADALLVAGGDALYLCHWLRQSGLAELLPSLPETVWVDLSAGSRDEKLGVVDFCIFRHLAPEGMRGNSMADAVSWAAEIAGPAYAIDDETAIRVDDGAVDVVSEGNWRLFGA